MEGKDQNEVKEFGKNVDQRLVYGEMMKAILW